MRKIRPGSRTERGQSLIEFGFASSIFFMLLFGIMQMGLAVWNYNTLASLAQDGARWAAVRGAQCYCTQADATSVRDYVRSRVVGMPTNSVNVTTTWPDGGSPSNIPGNTVQVRVEYTFPSLTAVVPVGNLSMHGVAQMKITR